MANNSSGFNLEVQPLQCIVDSIASGSTSDTQSVNPAECNEVIPEPAATQTQGTELVGSKSKVGVKGQERIVSRQLQPISQVGSFLRANQTAAAGSAATVVVITTILILRSVGILSFRTIASRLANIILRR